MCTVSRSLNRVFCYSTATQAPEGLGGTEVRDCFWLTMLSNWCYYKFNAWIWRLSVFKCSCSESKYTNNSTFTLNLFAMHYWPYQVPINIFKLSIKDAQSKGKLLPVLFWIHGGGFQSGSSDIYRPTYFMDEDVVLVGVNYRLGALG